MLAKRNASPVAQPSVQATALLLLGLLVAYALNEVEVPTRMLRKTAAVVGLSLVASFALEAHFTSLKNLVRVDNISLFALYFLTFFEFFFPQGFFDSLVTGTQTAAGTHLVLLGMGSIAIGRHLVLRRPAGKFVTSVPSMTEKELFWLAVLCFVTGHLHMWMAVSFNPFEWLREMMGARFSQSWQRSQLGGFSALLTELYWLTCLIPAIAAILWVRRKRVPAWMLISMGGMLALVMFSGFSLGARYQFAFYLLSFGGGFVLSLPRLRFSKVLVMGLPLSVLFLAATFLVVNFRNLGIKRVVDFVAESKGDKFDEPTVAYDIKMWMEGDQFKFIIDRNMYPISVFPDFFPDKHPFLEEEMLLQILVRPVPRALWPGKPEGLSVSVEGMLGIEGATVASTFVGESFMAYGVMGVIGCGLLLGIALGMWNRIPVNTSNATLILMYTSGFVWAPLAVRSVIWISIGFLPCVGLFLYAWYLIPVLRGRSRTMTNLHPFRKNLPSP